MEARSVVLHHWDVAREAVRAKDDVAAARALSTVEAGPFYDAHVLLLSGQIAERHERHRELPPRPPDLKEVRVAIAHQRRYPVSFLALTLASQTDDLGNSSDKLAWTLSIYNEIDPSTGWKQVLQTALEDPNSFPALSLDPGGYATATVTAASTTVRPATLPSAYAQYLTSGLNGKPSASVPFASGTFTDQQVAKTRDQIKTWHEGHATLQVHNTMAPQLADTYAYSTAAGGYMAIFAIREEGSLFSGGAYCLSQAADRHQFGDPVRPDLYSRLALQQLITVGADVPAAPGAPVRVLAHQEATVKVDSAPCY